MKRHVYLFVLVLLCCSSVHSGAQYIYQYTSDVGGAPSFVTTGLSATNLAKVGGGTNTPCGSGFSGFTVPTSYTTYSTSDPAINVDLTPAIGYTMTVTSVSVGIRRSGTGPNNCRLAYSVDGGATWVDKGSDDFPNNSGCGSMSTATWTFPCLGGVTVGNPGYLKFRLFYFNSSNSSGTTQVMNLFISGTVTNGCTPPTASISGSTSFCNSGSTTITFTGTPNATVTYTVNNGPNQNIVLNCSGTATLNTGLLAATTVYSLVSASFGNACTQNIAGSATVTVTPTPTIAVTPSNPTTCGGTNGTLTINGLTTGNTYTVHYLQNAVPQTFVATAAANAIVISNLAAGSYTNIYVTINSCNSNTVAGPITLADPPAPVITSIAATDPTTCAGTNGTITLHGLLANTAYTLNYSLNNVAQGPVAITSNAAGDVIILNLSAGTYSNITLTISNCISNTVGPVTLVSPVPPVISSLTFTNPTTCAGTDGAITLHGLLANTAYAVYYSTALGPLGPLTLSSNAAGDLVIGNLVAGTYSNIYVTWLSCTSNIAGPVTLFAPIPPVISSVTPSDPSTCSGVNGSLTLSGLQANVAYTVSYSFNAAPQTIVITSNAAGNLVINGLPAGSYSGIGVSALNCSSNVMAGPYILSDPPAPVISSSTFINPATCSGTNGSITLSGLIANTTYQLNYSKNAVPQGPISISSNASGSIIISALSSGQYSNITVTLANCMSNIVGPLDLVDPTPPQISSLTYTDPSTCNGSQGTFTISGLSPSTAYNLHYTFGSPLTIAITTDAAGKYTLTSLPAGTYSSIFVVQNNCTSNVVGPVVLTDPAPPAITNLAYTDPATCGGLGTITLSGLLSNQSYAVYYSFNAAPQGPVTLAANGAGNIVISGLVAGLYQNIYVIRQACTSNIVGPITLAEPVGPPPPLTTDITYCQSEQALPLIANGQNLLWYNFPTGGTGLPAMTPSTAVPGSFTFYVSQTVNNCESNRAALTVTVKPKPAVPVTGISSYTYCQFEAGAQQLSATGSNLLWYTQPAGGVGVPTAPLPATNISGVFTWYVTQSINGCESDRQPIVVTIYPKPQPPVVSDIKYCENENAAPLTAIGQNLKWYSTITGGTPQLNAPVPVTTGADTVTWYVSQSLNGCESDRAAITYRVYYTPSAAIKASKDVACQYDTLTFSYTGNGDTSCTYNWSVPAAGVIVAGTGQGPLKVRFDGFGLFTVSLVVDNHGCKSALAQYAVNIKSAPEVQISVPPSVCVGDTANVAITYANGPVARYAWDFDAAHIFPVKHQRPDGPYFIKWNTAGIHTVALTAENDGCYSKTVIDTVIVHEAPEAKIQSVSRNNICSGDTITFAASTNDPLNRYWWYPEQYFDFGNGTAVAQGVIDITGFVRLQVTSPFGCLASDSLMITAPPCCHIAFPNAFTPNGDGNNDKFRPIQGVQHQLTYFRIFNRWGNIVYESLNATSGWDGSVNGVAQDAGTYYYQLKYTCDGKIMDENGEFTLLR